MNKIIYLIKADLKNDKVILQQINEKKKFFLMASTRWHNLSTTTSLQLLNGAVLTDKCLIHWDQWFGCMSVIITNML